MTRFLVVWLALAFTPPAQAAVSFTREVAPILVQECSACHDAKKAKGGFRLHTYAALMSKPVDQEPAVVPGKPDGSRLFQLLVTPNPDDRMPQEDEPLSSAQIATIRQWISEGAKFDNENEQLPLESYLPDQSTVRAPLLYPATVPITALAFSPDGKQLASSGYHEVLLWNTQSGQLQQRLGGLPQKIHDLAYSPDGNWLVVASGIPGKLGRVNAIELHSAKVLVLANASDVFLAAAFSNDGTTLAAGAADHSIRLIDWASRKQSATVEQHSDWVMALAFLPDGKHFVSASRDKTARMIGTSTRELESTYQGHGGPIFAVAVNEKGDRLFTAGRDRKIHIWEPKDAKKSGEIGTFDGDIFRLCIFKDRLFAAGAEQTIFEHRSTGQRDRLRTYSGHRDAIFSLALSQDGQRLASGSFDGEIRLWDTASGELLRAFPGVPPKTVGAASIHNSD